MVNAYKNALQSLWVGRCSVYIKETVINPSNGRNEPIETCVLSDEPCRLSFSSTASTQENNDAALVQQAVKLYISKEVEIPPGSKLVITQEGVTGAYTKSGKPAVYRCHQQIDLEAFKGWA